MTTFIGNKDNARAEVKIKKSELKALEAKIEQETKPIIKQLFDYQIPIAQVEKAGITTTEPSAKMNLKSCSKNTCLIVKNWGCGLPLQTIMTIK